MVAVRAQDDGVDVEGVGVLEDEFVWHTVAHDTLDGRAVTGQFPDRPDTPVTLVLGPDRPELCRAERRLVVRPSVDDTEDVEVSIPVAREFDGAALGPPGGGAPVGREQDVFHANV